MEIQKYIKIGDISIETIRKLLNLFKEKITNEKKTKYDTKNIPNLDLQTFIIKIRNYCRIHNWNIVMGFMLIEKLLVNNPEISLNTNNIHRLLLVAMMVQNKYSEDIHYNNIHWAKVLDLPIKKMNRLELNFLCDINFDLNVSFPDILIFLIEKSLFINNSICNVIREKLDDEDKEYKLNEFFSDIKNIPKEEYKYDPTNWHDYLKYYFKHNILIVVSSPTSNSLSPLFPFSIR